MARPAHKYYDDFSKRYFKMLNPFSTKSGRRGGHNNENRTLVALSSTADTPLKAAFFTASTQPSTFFIAFAKTVKNFFFSKPSISYNHLTYNR